MAIADTITSMQTHTSNAYTMIGYGTDLTGINKNLANLSSTIFEAFLESLRNPDTLFTNLPKKSGTGSNITLNDTANAPMRITLGASELSQSGTPTPSSPQDIHTISGSNTIKVENKNLIQISYVNSATTQYVNVLYIKADLKPSTQYTISFIAPSGNKYYTNQSLISGWHEKTATGGTDSITFTTASTLDKTNTNQYDTTNGWIILKNSISQSNNNVFNNLQLEYGSTATTYTPFVSQEADIDLGEIEYCKISTYEDKIFKNIPAFTEYDNTLEEGAWYIKKNIGKVVLDGTESWGTNASWNYTNTNCYVYTWNLAPTTMLSNYYKYNSSTYNNDVSGQMGIVWGGSILLRIDKTIASDVADFKTWLSTHNTTIMYPLATPTYTQITGTLASQLENVYQKMLSYDGTTNISQVNNDLAFGLSVSALQDLG